MDTFVEVFLWLAGEIFWKVAIPYLLIFGIGIGTIRFLIPTWQVPATVIHGRVWYRLLRSIAWGLDLGFGNNNRRGSLLFPLLVPFVLYWGFSQPMGPPTLPTTLERAKELVPAAGRLEKDYGTWLGNQLESVLYSFHRFTLGKPEADRRRNARLAAAPILEKEKKDRETAALVGRAKDSTRWYVGLAIAILYIPFVLFYFLCSWREEVHGWAERTIASAKARRPSHVPAAAAGSSAATTTTHTPHQMDWASRMEMTANMLLHFYHMLPGGRR